MLETLGEHKPVPIDTEIADPRHFKRMHPNYYFVNKEDITGRS